MAYENHQVLTLNHMDGGLPHGGVPCVITASTKAFGSSRNNRLALKELPSTTPKCIQFPRDHRHDAKHVVVQRSSL